MATRRNDSLGYKKGARGIDGNDGEGFQEKNVDWKAVNGMYGRNWSHNGLSGGKNDITSGDPGKGSGSTSSRALLDSAVGGQRRQGKFK